MQATAFWITARQQGELRTIVLNSSDVKDNFLTMLYSGISRGTERLVYNGLLPAPDREFMRCPNMEGSFPFPVKYGYCAVARVEKGENKGRNVFCLHPHQSHFTAEDYTLLPEGLPPARAVLAANMETALNAVWDGGVLPGQRVVIVGAGVVGLLIGYLCARIHGVEAWVIDINQARREIAEKLGCQFQKPLDAPYDADVVFHTSATSSGLACALACAGVEAKVVEVSWFGDNEPNVPLGAGFHPKRLQLISSQVGSITPVNRPRWDYAKRMAKALEFLQDDALDALITHEVAFEDLPAKYGELLSSNDVIAARVTYKG
jgi:NADPH:quinone reductase-like Zn-dependent oxidoreductase